MKSPRYTRMRYSIGTLSLLAAFLSAMLSPAATINSTYIGGATSSIDTPANWTNGLPTASGDNGTLTWSGSTAGNLALTYSSAVGSFGGGSGVYMSLSSSQTGSVSIDNTAGSTQRIRTLGITVASGAGALTYGNGSGSTVELLLGTGSATYNFTNNSANSVTFNSEVLIDNGGNQLATLVFAGSGIFDVRGTIATSGGGVASTVTMGGAGKLNLSGVNAYAGATTVTSGVLSFSNVSNGGVSMNTTTTSGTNVGTVASTASLSVGQAVGGFFPAGTTITAITSGTTFTTSANANSTATNSLTFYGAGNALGISSNSASNLIINGGTLQYTGTAASTDRLFSIGTSGGTLDASGTGAINFTNSGSMGFNGQSGTRTLTLTGTNTGNNTLSAAIGNNGGATSLVKSGWGTWVLSGTSSYTGSTQVSVGTLVINGSIGGSSASVATGAHLKVNGAANTAVTVSGLLSGTGTVGAVSLTGGTLSPGNSIGTLNSGSLSLDGNSHLAIELGRSIAGAGTLSNDRVNVAGSVSLANGADLQLSLAQGQFDPVYGDILFLVINDGGDLVSGVFTSLNGVATNLNEGSLFTFNSLNYRITYQADFGASSFTGGNDIALLAVPEPATWTAIVAAGSVIILARRRRS